MSKVNRSAKSGKFVTRKFAKSHPTMTVTEMFEKRSELILAR